MQKRRGISPVIATVIIVAVTIAVAIAVAFWMTGIIGLFTGTVEKVEFVSLYAVVQGNNFVVTAILRNTGTAPVTIDRCFLNGVPDDQWPAGINIRVTAPADVNWPPTINPGGDVTIQITIPIDTQLPGGATLTHGVSLEVKFHSTGGREYPRLTVLP
jgi:flagellin-like protein